MIQSKPMRVLIVYAHPEEKSFCAALKNQAVDILEGQGNEVMVSDLYTQEFNPTLTRKDFMQSNNEQFFKPQLEQMHSAQQLTFAPDVAAEQQKLLLADILLFYCPLWWFSFPAIMKGWVDRVFAMGFAYGGNKGLYSSGPFKDKKGMLVITTGGEESAYQPTGRNGDLNRNLYPIHHGILSFCGMQVLEPFAAFAPAKLSLQRRRVILKNHAGAIRALDERPAISV